jgi:uncharacterized protein YdeI (BOF family)
MKSNLIRGSVLALTLSVGTIGAMYAQDAKPSQDTPQTAQPSQTTDPNQAQPTSTQNAAKEFMGTIVKDNGAFMLKDSSGSMSYKVDDESKVKDYVGKQVKVTGTLDSSSNVIHVDSIQVIS